MKKLFILLVLLAPLPASWALHESEVKSSFDSKILPFLKSGEHFSIQTEDSLLLDAVYFKNPNSIGTILVIPGRSEPWLKYGEVFYDLFQKGYSIYSYDHRGQGHSAHLSSINPEIGHITRFHAYLEDLNLLVEQNIKPQLNKNEKLYLLAHSMGGAIAAGYLSEYSNHPFQKAILSSPMLQINTKPYPEPIARMIVGLARLLGLGNHYAAGQKDYDLDSPFLGNQTTRSEARYWLGNEIFRRYPETIIGGPSNAWVSEGIKATHHMRREMGEIRIPFILFQAQADQIVKPRGQNKGCAQAKEFCTLLSLPDAEHELLMERDSIRNEVMNKIFDFFN